MGGGNDCFCVCIAKLLEIVTGASHPLQLGERGATGWNYRSQGDGQPKLPAGLTHKDVTLCAQKIRSDNKCRAARALRSSRGSNPDHYLFVVIFGVYDLAHKKSILD